MSRECGECRACCTVLGIEDLKKPNHTRCEHECDKGCAIYNDGRPQVCIDFKCGWLESDDDFRNMERPDKLGLIFAASHRKDSLARLLGFQPLLAHEVWPNAATSDAAQKTLKRIARTALVCVRAAGDASAREDSPVYGPARARGRAVALMSRAIYGEK